MAINQGFTSTQRNQSDDTYTSLNAGPYIAVVKVIPFLIVANPVILVLGVNSSSEIIAIRLPSLNHFVIFWLLSPESNIES